ncbi:MAG: hypothetical protein FWC93_04295, partial [Defluviitaleaceae bacterium]|nr:hypothetical protein [Defluviitaleaceae bacterium]
NQAYINMIDVRKLNADWEFINLTVESGGRVVEMVLVNDLYVAAVFGARQFNHNVNGLLTVMPGPAINIIPQIHGVDSFIPYADVTITATLPNGQSAMQFVDIRRLSVDSDYIRFIQVSMNWLNPWWSTIDFTLEFDGHVVELLLVNVWYGRV